MAREPYVMIMENLEKVTAFLQESPIVYFATVEGDKPRVRPFGFHMVYDGKLCFGIGTHKKSYQQIMANPNIEVCGCNAAKGQWLRIRGTVAVVADEQALEKAMKVMPALLDMYNEKTGLKLGIVALEPGAVAELADMRGGFDSCTL